MSSPKDILCKQLGHSSMPATVLESPAFAAYRIKSSRYYDERNYSENPFTTQKISLTRNTNRCPTSVDCRSVANLRSQPWITIGMQLVTVALRAVFPWEAAIFVSRGFLQLPGFLQAT